MSETREVVSKTLTVSWDNQLKDIELMLARKPKEMTREEVLKNYQKLIDGFNDDQDKQWAEWSTVLPDRIVDVSKKQVETVRSSRICNYANYIFIGLSAIMPFIISYLTTTLQLPDFAKLLDLLFPALVGIMTTVKTGVDNKRDALIAVKSPYDTLLSQIVVDIAQNNYPAQKETHRGTWKKLDAVLISAKIEM